jgi:hypothetical protein
VGSCHLHHHHHSPPPNNNGNRRAAVQSTLAILSFYYLLNTPVPEQQRQRLFSRDTTPPLPCKSEGSHCSCHPSLARNARQRGPTALAIPSLARSARRRGYFSFGTSPPLPCMKRKSEGSFLSRHVTAPPLQETQVGGVPPAAPVTHLLPETQDRGVLLLSPPPPLHEAQDGGVIFSLSAHHHPSLA